MTVASDPLTLSIATINCANLGEWSDEARLHKFIRSMVEDLSSPMIIAVQEIGGRCEEGGIASAVIVDEIIRILKEQYQQDYCYAEIAPLAESSGGADDVNIRCGFFYRAPIKLISLGQIGNDLDVFVGNDDGEFAASRLPLLARFGYGAKVLNVINCHLKSMSIKTQTKKQAKKQRNKQAVAIADYVIEHDLMQLPLFIVGDMNDTFASKTMQAMVALGLASAHSSLNYQVYTYKYHKKNILLDYILYNGWVKNLESKIIHINTDKNSDYAYSDHDPLLMIGRIC